MKPTQIKRDKEARTLIFTWDDGHVSHFPLSFLRDECPCAGCKGEVILGRVYKPQQLAVYQEGMYELAKLEQVGQYAVQAFWKDGHDTGIYSWEWLRMLEAELEQSPKSN